jgi:NhaP-type Na+/H+ and K+/H+ antiporter
VVFSVLGRREVGGRSGTILERESGANDPVGIALMASLLTAGQSAGVDAAGSIAGTFLLQLAVGAAVGVAGGRCWCGSCAVPILLGSFLLTAGVPDASRRYAEPWSPGVRFRNEPRGLRRHLVAAGSPADGCRIGDLEVGGDAWISFVIRDDQLVPVSGSTILWADDEILALTHPERGPDLTPILTLMPGTGHAGMLGLPLPSEGPQTPDRR